jgi:glucokinase
MATLRRTPGSPLRGVLASGGNAAHLRRLNMDRLLIAVMDRSSPFTRAELIKVTGLSAPTVGSLVSQLIRSGVVRDLGAGPSRGGRRPLFMEFNAQHGFVAGVDLGPTRTRIAVADLRGEPLVHRIVPTPTGLGPSALLSRLAGCVRGLLKDAGVAADRLLAVGAGAPGAVDCERGVVDLAPNLEGWSRVPMQDILQRALGAPVVVENDVNLAVLGEHWRGAARGHDTCAFVFAGTGIGAGVLIDGQLHRGQHFMAGEIAAMCMGPQFVDVDFGARGCLETLAGLKALARRWPRSAHSDPERWLAELMQAAAAGDRRALRAVEETARLIAIAVANVAAVLDPSLIVLGGALFVGAEPLVAEVRKTVGRIAHRPLPIVVSTLGKEAPLSGCLLIAANEAHVRLRQRIGGLKASA